MEKKVQRNFLWIALLVLGTIWILARHNRTQPYYTVNGLIFGTVYNITYQYDGDLKAEIDEELKRFDGSLSPFNDTATITRINRNEDIVPDTFFTNVFRRSMEISKETNGAFDITVAPLKLISPFLVLCQLIASGGLIAKIRLTLVFKYPCCNTSNPPREIPINIISLISIKYVETFSNSSCKFSGEPTGLAEITTAYPLSF